MTDSGVMGSWHSDRVWRIEDLIHRPGIGHEPRTIVLTDRDPINHLHELKMKSRCRILVFVTLWRAAFLLSCLSMESRSATAAAEPIHRQWDVIELQFDADSTYENPFDDTHCEFVTVWTAPNGQQYRMPGFWDGGKVWKNRFMPTMKGTWRYETQFQVAQDTGLNGMKGEVEVQAPAEGCPLTKKHGGMLKPSRNGRFLTYTDGTPFFWLGDIWFRFPAGEIPLDFFKRMVDHRVAQRYTVFSGHGTEPMVPGGARPLEAILPTPAALQYWRALDPYMAYAAERGMVAMIGYGAFPKLEEVTEETLKTFFRYHLARYGAFPVSYFFTQEYNAAVGKPAERIPKFLRLGQYIKDIDPYQRALTLHPWVESKDGHEAWNQPWYDMIWLQAGHFRPATAELISPAYAFSPPKPVVQSEHNFEGFQRNKEIITDRSIREVAYTTFQAGGAGFTYGAQGLYAGIMDKKFPATTARWGPVLTSEEALQLPGGNQMRYLAGFYRSLPWWQLEPKPHAMEGHPEILVKACATDVAIYFPTRNPLGSEVYHLKVKHARRSTILGHWFNPRDGKSAEHKFSVDAEGRILIPSPPDLDDWLLRLSIGTEATPQSRF